MDAGAPDGAELDADAAALMRPPETVMRLSRMGSFHQTRLSFMRVLLRGLRAEGWRFDRPLWEIDASGVGRAVYRSRGPAGTFCLVAFAHDLPDHMRSDRVIATAWDATFALTDGEPGPDDLDRLAANVPLQEAGRISGRELCLSRANRSVRLWRHVVESLAAGRQPDDAQVEAVGYLVRTTAVYGSGKFGAADREALAGRGLLDGPFRAEMLSVWLIRAFSIDLAEHMAAAAGGAGAARMAPDLRRRLGVGNSTGLGMAPFLVNHPELLHAWMAARETALARVRALPRAGEREAAAFASWVRRARANAEGWRSEHPLQKRRLADLRADLDRLSRRLNEAPLTGHRPWDRLFRWAEGALTEEGQEQLVSLLLEPHGPLVDDLAESMSADEEAGFAIDGAMRTGRLRALIEAHCGWALGRDYDSEAAQARFWYVSEEKLEPRLGERFEEPGAELEQPLATGRDIAALHAALAGRPEDERLANLLLARPDLRHAARRVQVAARAPYAEIRDNLVDAEVLPIDMLRCKLSFFGATRFDPRSDRWVRICMYQGAPFPHELAEVEADDWGAPPDPAADAGA